MVSGTISSQNQKDPLDGKAHFQQSSPMAHGARFPGPAELPLRLGGAQLLQAMRAGARKGGPPPTPMPRPYSSQGRLLPIVDVGRQAGMGGGLGD